MIPKIENLPEKKLIGMYKKMTLIDNKTAELWKKFMIRRNEIKNRVNADFISMNVYDKSLEFKDFNPNIEFEKWAVVEVKDFNEIPDEMEKYTLEGGKYAVFIHKGAASTFHLTQQYIFGTWLPNSKYELDNREHFEVLKSDYVPTDPNAEEEVYIPIKLRENKND